MVERQDTRGRQRSRFDVGTWQWAQRTGGRLSKADRLQLVAQAVFVRFTTLSASLRRRLGFTQPGLVRVDFNRLRVPDSSVARQAEALCRDVSPPHLLNHCQRTYLWGALLAQHDALTYDEELFYVASLLHDLGLTSRYGGIYDGVRCFGVDGAIAANEFAQKVGWEERRREALADAIGLHLNVKVGVEYGPEAHLLSAGAALDVIGLRFGNLTPGAIQAVLSRYPRLGFKRNMDALARAQIEARPESRIHFLYRDLRFGQLLMKAPFEE